MGERHVTEVACGVLIERATHRFLLGSRPEGKPYAGYWEFPGGKLEAGETVHEALKRELREELGLAIGPSYPWFVIEHDYPHAYVRLHFRRCFCWEGAPRCLEQQEFVWMREGESLASLKLLPMDALVIERISLPDVVTTERVDDLGLYEGLDARRGVIVSTLAEMAKACEMGLAYAIASPGCESTLLRGQLNGLPLYVVAKEDELERWWAQGAHGVVCLRR